MGWLFAVALGLQERKRAKVIAALFPIAIGHLVSIATVVAAIAILQSSFPFAILRPAGAGTLIVFGLFRFLWPRAHPRWVAMRVNFGELTLWSFLMASAHGAGLMLFPILLGMNAPTAMPGMHHHGFAMASRGDPVLKAAAVVILHTGAMLAMMGAIAILVYEKLGLAILRSAWINLDTVWALALVAAGLLCLFI